MSEPFDLTFEWQGRTITCQATYHTDSCIPYYVLQFERGRLVLNPDGRLRDHRLKPIPYELSNRIAVAIMHQEPKKKP